MCTKAYTVRTYVPYDYVPVSFQKFGRAKFFPTWLFLLLMLRSPSGPVLSTMTHSTLSEELHAIAAGLVGGAEDGFKIWLPHAMVMIWLFRRDLSSKQEMMSVGKLVVEHTTNLAAFAALYKVYLYDIFIPLSTVHWLSPWLVRDYVHREIKHNWASNFSNTVCSLVAFSGQLRTRTTVLGKPTSRTLRTITSCSRGRSHWRIRSLGTVQWCQLSNCSLFDKSRFGGPGKAFITDVVPAGRSIGSELSSLCGSHMGTGHDSFWRTPRCRAPFTEEEHGWILSIFHTGKLQGFRV